MFYHVSRLWGVSCVFVLVNNQNNVERGHIQSKIFGKGINACLLALHVQVYAAKKD